MKKFKKKGFTLIELIAVLVIMAILALIVTPLVMNIIRKARISADKRSVDAYGRSIELAIAGYLLDTGKFVTSIDELTIEYSGDTVICETTQINPDSSVYLSNCKVNNREVTNYTYGTDKSPSYEAYSVGDLVTYNGVDYYVIKDSGIKDNVVTLLKATPLTTEEVNTYGGVGTENNHVNNKTNDYVGTSYDKNGYGAIAYYSGDNCGYIGDEHYVLLECKNNYDNSDIKYIVDRWSADKIKSNLNIVRLLTKEELENYIGYEEYEYSPCGPCGVVAKGQRLAANWLYSDNYSYWTMSYPQNSEYSIFYVDVDGSIKEGPVYSPYSNFRAIRPVVELYKNDGITKKNSSNN